MLKDLSDKYGYEVLVIDKMQEDKRDISSTFVREEIAKGNIEKANHLLGYHYFVTGEILHGRHLGSTRTWNPDDQPDSAGGKTASGEWCLCDRSAAWRPELPWRYKRWGETDD